MSYSVKVIDQYENPRNVGSFGKEDEGVGTGIPQLPGEAAGRFEFVVPQDSVDGDQDACVVAVGMVRQAGDVGDRIAGAGTGAEGRSADIDGVGAVVYGGDAEVGITGRCQEFEGANCGLEHRFFLREPNFSASGAVRWGA